MSPPSSNTGRGALDRVEDATIALAEALNNIEEHAYGGRPDLPVLLRIIQPRGPEM
jgi:anti-sigma regulatory factor (Ser/Thr protein kinase)